MPESDDAVADSDGGTGESLTTDRALDLLGDARRRRAIAVLRERDGEMALRELAAAVVERAPTEQAAERSTDRHKRVAASLHHCHLPKLADAGVVDYSPAANRVKPTPVAEELDPFFEVVETRIDDLQWE